MELLYITDQLPSQIIKIENPADIENLTIEIRIRKNKGLVAGIYKLPKLNFTSKSPKTKYYRDYRKFDIDYF